jgi:hypothetical protein
VIDVALDAGPTYAWHREVIGSQAESIVAVIRAFAGSRPADVGAWPAGGRRPRPSLVTAGEA